MSSFRNLWLGSSFVTSSSISLYADDNTAANFPASNVLDYKYVHRARKSSVTTLDGGALYFQMPSSVSIYGVVVKGTNLDRISFRTRPLTITSDAGSPMATADVKSFVLPAGWGGTKYDFDTQSEIVTTAMDIRTGVYSAFWNWSGNTQATTPESYVTSAGTFGSMLSTDAYWCVNGVDGGATVDGKKPSIDSIYFLTDLYQVSLGHPEDYEVEHKTFSRTIVRPDGGSYTSDFGIKQLMFNFTMSLPRGSTDDSTLTGETQILRAARASRNKGIFLWEFRGVETHGRIYRCRVDNSISTEYVQGSSDVVLSSLTLEEIV